MACCVITRVSADRVSTMAQFKIFVILDVSFRPHSSFIVIHLQRSAYELHYVFLGIFRYNALQSINIFFAVSSI